MTQRRAHSVVAYMSISLVVGAAACGCADQSTAGNAENLSVSSQASAPPPALEPLGPTAALREPVTGAPITDSNSLQATLLSAADLPAGFVALADPDVQPGVAPPPNFDEADKSSTDPPACAAILATVASQAAGAVTTATIKYSGPDFASIDEDVASYPAVLTVPAFAAIQSKFANCRTYSGTDADGVPVQYALGGLSQPAQSFGDSSVQVRLETSSDGVTLVSDAVLFVVGSTIAQVVATGQQSLGPDVLAAAASAAADHIRAAH